MIVYGLHTGDKVIRYVGATTLPMHRRLIMHTSFAKKHMAQPLHYWLVENIDRIETTIFVECDTKSELHDHERRVIAELREQGMPLMNMTDGGPGTPGWHPTKENRAKRRATLIERYGHP